LVGMRERWLWGVVGVCTAGKGWCRARDVWGGASGRREFMCELSRWIKGAGGRSGRGGQGVGAADWDAWVEWHAGSSGGSGRTRVRAVPFLAGEGASMFTGQPREGPRVSGWGLDGGGDMG